MAKIEYKSQQAADSISKAQLPRIDSDPANSDNPVFELKAKDLSRAGFYVGQEVHVCVLSGCIILMPHKEMLYSAAPANRLPV